MSSDRSVRRRARAMAPLFFATAFISPSLFSADASAQTWISRVNASFSVGANWAGGVAPVSSASTELTFTNPGAPSYRAFNDLGVLTIGGITLQTRTNTATFIAQPAGSALQFADGAFLRSTDSGLFRFGGVSGVLNDWRLMGNLTFGGTGYGNVYVASPVADAAGFAGHLTIDAPTPNDRDSFLRLEGANTFSGGVDLKRGNLQIGNAAGLGTGVVTANGGTFRTTASMTVANSFVTNSPLKLRPETGFTISGVISGAGGIDLRSIGPTTASAVTLTGANTYTGPTVIDYSDTSGFNDAFPGLSAGSIVFSGPAGSALNSSSYTVRNGGVLAFTNTGTGGVTNRLNDTAPISLQASRLNAVGNATAGNLSTERFGTLTLNGGGNTVFVNGGNGGVTLSTPNLVRSGRATLGLTLGNANSRLITDTAPSLTGGIVPWAAGITGTLITAPRDLITYETGAFRTLTSAEYASDFSAGPSSNVKLTGAINNDAVVDVNALVLSTGTFNLTGSGTIRPASGAVVIANSGTIQNNIDFGAAEGVIHVGAISAIDGVISGSNGITKSGEFALDTAGAHTYTGVTTINAGGFRFTNPHAFDTTSGFVNNTAGGSELVPSLDYRGAGLVTIDKPAVVEGGAFRLSTGSVTTSQMIYSGVISGPGVVYLEEGRIDLTADNTHLGGTRISRAETELSRDSVLGAPGAPFEIAGTIGRGIVLTGNWSTDRTIRVTETSRLDTNGFDATWNGPVEVAGALTKVGAGTLRINGYGPAISTSFWEIGTTGGTPGGRVELSGDSRFSWTVNSGVLAVDGTTLRVTVSAPGPGIAGRLEPGDVGGAHAGTMEASFVALTRGSSVLFDLGAQSDLIRSITTLNRGGSGTDPVTFDFRVGEGITLSTYTLIDYFEDPSATLTFAPGDFAYTSSVDGFAGTFDIITTPQGTRAVTFTVTSVPEPSALSAMGLAAATLFTRRRRAAR